MVIKLRSERRGSHIHETVFVGPDEDHLANSGTLVLEMGEWQDFGVALSLGARAMHGRVKVILEGDNEVVGKTEGGIYGKAR